METIDRTTAAGQWTPRAPFSSLHHVALVTKDMKQTVAFYRDLLGGEVVMAHRLPRPGNERHYFISVTPHTVFAFFEFPAAQLPEHKAATLPSTGRALDHIAFFAPDVATFEDWHRRLTDAGVAHLTPVRPLGPGMRAFFFADPNGIVLEVMCPPAPGTWLTAPALDDPDPAY